MSRDITTFADISDVSGAAPHGSARTHAASNNMHIGRGSTRRRRRGPRSALACSRRKCRRLGGAPTDAAFGESRADASVPINFVCSQSFVLYCINIRCVLSNLAELCLQVKELSPHIILLQETWLNASVEEIRIPNYKTISRRDRSELENRGGVMTFARLDVINIMCVKICSDSERIWHLLHVEIGAIAICNWYRPGSGGEAQIASLANDLAEIREEVIGIVLMGDINVHHRKWLRYSNGNSADGELLRGICDDYGLRQLIDSPTTGIYLLDLVVSDLERCKIEVIGSIADHCGILAKIALPCPKELRVHRELWHFKGAAWSNLKCALRACSWNR